ncbi:MAG TPA: phage integrase N-terminal SAM-like domain-containing protein, partial [Roseiflexaceae bacterium]|nr:phage integrase N-terminal SAM-like domain-containing protein [Roseiflexaceae bacterium]
MGTSPFLEHVRAVARLRHLSYRTEQAYVYTIKRFILFHGKRHPADMGVTEVRAYLTYLAVDQHVAASTQNAALCALRFLYRDVLAMELPYLDDLVWARESRHVPVVWTRDEVDAIHAHMHGAAWLVASLLYGSGLRLMECLRLRVKDID